MDPVCLKLAKLLLLVTYPGIHYATIYPPDRQNDATAGSSDQFYITPGCGTVHRWC
jgi:hypothetical protein